ncbi:MAG: head decoration protein [Sphingomonadaceae bacterium]|nr:head decoration protein [Sphingomonadaceae bacterium]
MGNPTVTPLVETRHDGGYRMWTAENNMISPAKITLGSGAGVVVAGTVLGQATLGTTATAAPLGTNVGNGTFGAITVTAPAVPGAYVVEFDSATNYIVSAPNGQEVGHGTTGAAFAAGGLGFTITAGGTAFAAGDSFTVTPAAGTGKWAPYNPLAGDGTEVAAGILFGTRDATSADQRAVADVRGPMRVNVNELIWGANVTTQLQQTTALAQLQALGILAS